MNEQYKSNAIKNDIQLEFKIGDPIGLHLRKEMFPSIRRNKLMARVNVPYKNVQKVGECLQNRTFV